MPAANQPTQRLFGFHPRRGLTFSYPIKLADRPELKAIDDIAYTPYDKGLKVK